jgi:hypothetical protein
VGSAAGYKIEATGPAGPTSVDVMVGSDAPLTSYNTTNTTAIGSGGATGLNPVYFRIVNGSTAGTFKLQFISVTNTQVNTIKAGSLFFAVRG